MERYARVRRSVKNNLQESEMHTVVEAGIRLGLKPVTIRKKISRREITHIKLGRSIRIPESEILRIIRENTIPRREGR